MEKKRNIEFVFVLVVLLVLATILTSVKNKQHAFEQDIREIAPTAQIVKNPPPAMVKQAGTFEQQDPFPTIQRLYFINQDMQRRNPEFISALRANAQRHNRA